MKVRHLQCYLLMAARLFCQSLRTSIGPLVPAMSAEMGFDTAAKASLLGAFSLGYGLTQIPGGELADRLGGKPVITAGILVSALAALAAPALSASGLPHLTACFVLMGAAQGPLFPVFSVMLGEWIPKSERSWASAITDSGSSMGQFLSILIAPWLGAALGWKAVYYGFGALTLLFGAVWQLYADSSPASCRRIGEDELTEMARLGMDLGGGRAAAAGSAASVVRVGSQISLQALHSAHQSSPAAPARSEGSSKTLGGSGGKKGAVAAAAPSRAIPWLLLAHPAVLAIFFCHFAHNYSIYFLNSWMPTYFSSVLGVEAAGVGVFLMVPEVAAFAMRFRSGAIAAFVDRRLGLDTLKSRRFFTAVAFGGQLVGLAMFAHASTATAATFWLTVLLAASAFSAVGWRANYLDVTKYYNGLLSGFGNTVATIPGYIGPLFAAFVLGTKDGSWSPLFLFMAAMNVLAIAVFTLSSVADPLDTKKEYAAPAMGSLRE